MSFSFSLVRLSVIAVVPVCFAVDLSNTPVYDAAPTLYEPYRLGLDGTPYDVETSKLDLKAIESGSFAVAFFGCIQAGKSRLIESLTGMPRHQISCTVLTQSQCHTKQAEIHVSNQDEHGHALHLIDTPGFGLKTMQGLRNAVNAIHQVRLMLKQRRVPLKRLYFVVSASRNQVSKITKNLLLLQIAFGIDVASRVRLIVNKSDTVRDQDEHEFEMFLSQLMGFYQDAFPNKIPHRPLVVSATLGFGQLLEDLNIANQCPELDLNGPNVQWSSEIIDNLNKRDSIRQRLGAVKVNQASLYQRQDELKHLKKKLHRTEMSIADAKASSNTLIPDCHELGLIWKEPEAESIFSQVNSLDESHPDDQLSLFYLTMEMQTNDKFDAAFAQRYAINDTAIHFDKTLHAWNKLEQDYWACKGTKSTYLDGLIANKAKMSEQISEKNQQIADMEMLLSSERLLKELQALAE